MSKIDLYKSGCLDVMDFRAWDKKEKTMLNFSDQGISPCRWVYDGGFDDMISNSEEDVIWMQFSGYRDFKENKIYAGDILSGRKNNHYFVTFDGGAFTVYHLHQKDYDGTPLRWGLLSRLFDSDMRDLLPFFEVIGNVFEDTVVEKE
ncbi:YopX family protein [Brevundimonas sp. FT23028]|uniref:YopX family protein n=1 Tax=Brevundimonas sp. FT23028 TaxID=3393748 RepID=UPI003B585F7F